MKNIEKVYVLVYRFAGYTTIKAVSTNEKLIMELAKKHKENDRIGENCLVEVFDNQSGLQIGTHVIEADTVHVVSSRYIARSPQ